ncbi:MAG: hypothetical protein NTW21_02685 [Verrucomicrobia bacterium]|nr:hypothetical protein [Verrucomicrobiota bacterium]
MFAWNVFGKMMRGKMMKNWNRASALGSSDLFFDFTLQKWTGSRRKNLWPNRFMGDAMLPPDQRRTKTNVGTYNSEKKGFRSGLPGPVLVMTAERVVK